MREETEETLWHLFIGVLLAVIFGFVIFAFWVVQKSHAQPEKAPAAQRSLEIVDTYGGGFDDFRVVLVRARGCYYLVVLKHSAVLQHLEDCPNPVHQGKK